MPEENKTVELKDEELNKVTGGDNNNTSTAQQMIEEFELRMGKIMIKPFLLHEHKTLE